MNLNFQNQIRLTAFILMIGLNAFSANPEKGLKDVFQGKFFFGTAMNSGQITGKDTVSVRIIKQHFNAITAENVMKSALIHPEEEKFNADGTIQTIDGLQ